MLFVLLNADYYSLIGSEDIQSSAFGQISASSSFGETKSMWFGAKTTPALAVAPTTTKHGFSK